MSYIWYTNWQIDRLEAHIESLKKDNFMAGVNSKECEGALEEQQSIMQELRADYNNSLKRFETFKNLPIKVKIKKERVIIYRDINTTKPRKEQNCEDYKKLESNTYNIDWNN